MQAKIVLIGLSLVFGVNLSPIQIKVAEQQSRNEQCDAYCFFIGQGDNHRSLLTSLETQYALPFEQIFARNGFSGKPGESFVYTGMQGDNIVQLMFVGLGLPKANAAENMETLRRAMGTLVKVLQKSQTPEALVVMPSSNGYGLSPEKFFEQLATIAVLASYDFSELKSKKQELPECTIQLTTSYERELTLAAIERGITIGEMINRARRWCDLPPNILTPLRMADEATALAQESNLQCTIFGRKKAIELGMGGFCAVDSGSSANPGQFIVLEYNCGDEHAPTIALVGKGVTFDTGGVSLKTAQSMLGMKYDMCGAAAVIATLGLAGKLKPKVNVIGIAPMVENMPDGASYREDDVITFMNGKTAEILNTDAEGRLILADGLCYAEKMYSPDLIIDLATLTGACPRTFDRFYAALLTRNNDLASDMFNVGIKTGDMVWRLPLTDDYKPAMSSPIADVSNSSKPPHYAGTITAAIFLENFVKETPWVHLDIAGASRGAICKPYFVPKQATGAGIRLLVEYIDALSQVGEK